MPIAIALDHARRQHAALLAKPRTISLSAAWQPVGPLQIGSISYGNVTGRVTSIAIDPADATGNTVYLGTTGGGVWKSSNAAGPAASVQFTPLTDTLPVYSPGAGSAVIPSLSIGALSVAHGVVLAGTGDPNDALDSYYGSGLLRSTDGGATWTLVQESHDGTNGNHSFLGLGFAGFAWSSSSPSVVVAAVADSFEGAIVNAANAEYSVRGLYFSTDAGETWQMATLSDDTQTVQTPLPTGENGAGNAATSVVWNPVRQRFYAAVRYHGYYESADGATWTRIAEQPGTGLTPAACPPNYGRTGSSACPILRGTLAVQPTSGDTFAFTVDANNLDQGIWRDVCGLNNGACSNSDVTFGAGLNTAPLEQGGGSSAIAQGDYNLSLVAVASGTDTLVFAGTVDLYRCSLAGGCNFRNTTNAENSCSTPAMVAPAQHALAAGSASLLFLGNDGGLWRSTDGVNQTGSPCSADDASHFQNLNGALGSLAEVVDFSQHPSDPGTLQVGVGASGTASTATATANAPWQQLAAGEGGFTAIDPANPTNRYASIGAGVNLRFCGLGASCGPGDFAGPPTIGATQVADDASLINPPWMLDPASTSSVLIGTCRVWRGPVVSGADWTAANAISQNFGGPQNASCTTTNPFLRSLAAGGPVSSNPAGSEVLYAGLAGKPDGGGSVGGHIFSTNAANLADATTVWTDLALSPVTNDLSDENVFNPGGFDISSVAVDPHDATGKTVYATVMGFGGNGTNAPHVYRSTDGGAHWTNISSNLPNAPANSIAVDPNDANTLYVALDTGVYATNQVSTCTTENCWSVFGVSLPNAPVLQLAAAAAMPAGLGGSVGALRAATYGRGIWQIPLLTATAPMGPEITLSPTSLSFAAQAVGSASLAQTITVTNSGNTPLLVTSVAATGDFQETDTCVGQQIAVAASCSVQVVFEATEVGSRSGILTLYGNFAGGQASAALTGTGTASVAVTLSPLSLNFGVANLGSTTAVQNITVSNSGVGDATLQSPSVTGDFQISANNCGTTLTAGVGCTVSIVFTPTATGTRNGSFTLADSAGTQVASLTGVGTSGVTDSLSPTSLSFASQQAGTVSATQTVTLTNSGDAALTLIAAQITSGDFTVVNGCGSSLSGQSSCSLQVAFAPTRAGTLQGALTVSDALRVQTVALSGAGVAPPTLALSPTTVSFSATSVGQVSAAQTVSISNSGNGQLTVTSIATSGDFAETDTCTGKSLAGAASCSVEVTFSPTAGGLRSGSLIVGANTGGSSSQQAATALSGTGLAPAAIVLTPASLGFGNVTLGSTSPAQNITISNTGGAPATLQAPAISGPFRISANTCGASLASQTGCTVAIVFAPTASGIANGIFSIMDSVGTQTASLTGSGASTATDGLAPLSLSFAAQPENTVGVSQAVTLTNTGDNPLTLIAIQLTGNDFVATNGCGTSLNGHSSCAIEVASAPRHVGATSGVLTVSDQFRSQTVTLSGAGTPPPGVSLSPTAGLTFAATGVTQTSAPQTVTLSNQGGSPLSLSGMALTGDFAILPSANTCGASVAVGAACSFQVVFAPTAGGSRTGTLSVADDAANSPQTLPLQGTGVDFALTADGAVSVTVSSGQSAVFPLLLSSASSTPGVAAMSCSGAPVNATCVVTPANPTLGTTSTISVTVETGITTSASLQPETMRSRAAWFAVGVPVALLCCGVVRRRRLTSLLLVAIMAGGLLSVTGCGVGRLIPPSDTTSTSTGSSPAPTPSGTYTILVSATSAGLTRTISLTLVVQ